ncbi:DNA repair helicase [Backusella circina FSU 941]|nr:DNA repair helicase [Backusella circina FSU 941]
MTDNFGFPFEPYDIQKDFMNELYNVLSKGNVGIFESPTGTGKSLSLICGSLKWLKDQEDNNTTTSTTSTTKKDEPDWLSAFQSNTKEDKQARARREKREELKYRIDRVKLKNGYILEEGTLKKKRFKKSIKTEDEEEDEFVLDDYESEGDDDDAKPSSNKNGLSKEVQALLAKMEQRNTQNIKYDDEDVDDEDLGDTKIYYASRTHSQLTQFVHEVNKTVYSDQVYEISLASRKGLCIHDEVRKLPNVARINEACLDMQKKDAKKKCEFLHSWDNHTKWNQFRDHALANIRDIEELVTLGEALGTCPYYGSRNTIKSAQLVVLPYQHLLHETTRASLGISLKDNIVIIDEAHNLIDTITSLYTVQLSQDQLQLTLRQLYLYIEKYKRRLLGKNVVYIQQIISIIKKMLKALGEDEVVMHVNDFTHRYGLDHINMFKIETYLEVSQLARKLNGFVDKARHDLEQQQGSSSSSSILQKSPSSIPTLTQVQAFLLALTHPDKDGRIVISGITIKYMLLNPADVFKPVVEEAKSVVLAGGTMEPVSEFMYTLFPSVPAHNISHFSCGHIIPSENLLTVTLQEGPTKKPFLFNFENRKNTALMDEVGQTIVNLCHVIPDGVVCFFPSFTYLEETHQRWTSTGMLDRIGKKKRLFKEPRESNQVEKTLTEYGRAIEESQGALLFCVVNGKMSEGINFSDQLGRGVIMIGLPFANRGSVELIEKMKFANQQTNTKDAGAEYYENLCMRGVNQSIGRAIRHKGDYATIVLLDKRYSQPRIKNKLPKWIGSHIEHYEQFGKVLGRTGKFFRERKQNNLDSGNQ